MIKFSPRLAICSLLVVSYFSLAKSQIGLLLDHIHSNGLAAAVAAATIAADGRVEIKLP